MHHRHASINDLPIEESDRSFSGTLPVHVRQITRGLPTLGSEKMAPAMEKITKHLMLASLAGID